MANPFPRAKILDLKSIFDKIPSITVGYLIISGRLGMDVISTFKAAVFCGVTKWTISRWIDSGKIKAFRTEGGHRKIVRNDLIAYMKSRNIPLDEILKADKKNILVVGKDASFTKTIKSSLDKKQFNLEFATPGFDAGVKLVGHKPHLVILDSSLSVSEANELYSQLKAMDSEAKTILVSEGKKKCGHQVDCVLEHPIGNEKLLGAVNELLSH